MPLPGGYPEFYLTELAKAEHTRRSIQAHAEAGGKILAECGGMMYLCRAIRDEEGRSYPMCGVLDLEGALHTLEAHAPAARAAAGGHSAQSAGRAAGAAFSPLEDDVPSEDDEDAEEAGIVGLEVVKRLLGATVLEEITVTQEGR